MATITYDSVLLGYWLDNGIVKCLARPNFVVSRISVTIGGTPRNVGYFYCNFDYTTEADVAGTFYLNSIGDFTQTISGTGISTVYTVLDKTYLDTFGVTHQFIIKISLSDGNNNIDIDFEDSASVGLKRMHLSAEANLYPQGYGLQSTPTNAAFTAGAGTLATGTYAYRVSALNAFGETLPSPETTLAITGPGGVNVNWGAVTNATGYKIYGRTAGAEQLIATVGAVTTYLDNGSITPSGAMPTKNATANFNAGGSTAYIAPAPFNNSIVSFNSTGTIKIDGVLQTTVSVIDNYICCYSPEASIAVYGRYVALQKVRVYTLNSGVETQWVWLHLIPTPLSKQQFQVSFSVGAWAVGSASSCQTAYGALPYVESLVAAPAAQYNRIVRVSSGADIYDYHRTLQQHLTNLNTYQPSLQGTAYLTGAGNCNYKYFKHRGQSSTWSGVLNDIEEDYVLKDTSMSRIAGKRLFVEIDILNDTWNNLYPGDTAIGPDEVTRYQTSSGYYYWVKLKRLITPGQAYHDAFISYVTYLCQNYNFYGLVISECFYNQVDYSSEAKAMFLADNPSYTDWPRKVDGSIDVDNQTLGIWKTQKLGGFWSEIQTIANANNKKFFVMVEPNFDNEMKQAWQYGQYYPEAITHCDGLWVWGYYGVFDVSAGKLQNIVNRLNALHTLYPAKENIVSIGLWGAGSADITPNDLEDGLDVLNVLGWPSTGGGIEVTPASRMTLAHWQKLWGGTLIIRSRYYNEVSMTISRMPSTIVDIGLDYCTRSFGVSPCLATGAPCFNTWPTCKYPSAYSKTTKNYKFCFNDTPTPLPGQNIRPYLEDFQYLGQEIDTGENIVLNQRLTLTMLDEPDNDVGIDPYRVSPTLRDAGGGNTQSIAAQGTFWRKLKARNSNYLGRRITVKQGFVDTTFTEIDYLTHFVGVLDNIQLDNQGRAKLIVKGLLQLTDTDLPKKTDGKLSANLGSSATSFTLEAWTGIDRSQSPIVSQYDASGYVKVGTEIIKYSSSSLNTATGITTFTVATGGRSQFSQDGWTNQSQTPTTWNAGEVVQQATVYDAATKENPIDIIHDLLNKSGIADADINTTLFAAERDTWFVGTKFRGILHEPKKIKESLRELREQTMTAIWQGDDQKIQIKFAGPLKPGQTYKRIKDAENVVFQSLNLDDHKDAARTRVAFYYDILAAASADEPSHFGKASVVIDAGMEGANGYGRVFDGEPIYSRWVKSDLAGAGYSRIIANRIKNRLKDGVLRVNFDLELKDDVLAMGEVFEFESASIVDFDGLPKVLRLQVIKRQRKSRGQVTYAAINTGLKARYAFIAPASYSGKVYSSAIAAEREYGFIANVSGKMSNGDDGYLTI